MLDAFRIHPYTIKGQQKEDQLFKKNYSFALQSYGKKISPSQFLYTVVRKVFEEGRHSSWFQQCVSSDFPSYLKSTQLKSSGLKTLPVVFVFQDNETELEEFNEANSAAITCLSLIHI